MQEQSDTAIRRQADVKQKNKDTSGRKTQEKGHKLTESIGKKKKSKRQPQQSQTFANRV